MDTITIPVKELYRQVKEMIDDGMDYVEMAILEADNYDPANPIPPSLELTAFSIATPEEGVCYDGIDAADVTPPED